MNIDFLTPIENSVVIHCKKQPLNTLAKVVKLHTEESFPDLADVKVAVVGVKDGRGTPNNFGCGQDLQEIRKYLYQLYPGSWNVKIADLGNIEMGNTISDTYFALSSVVSSLLKQNIIPVIIGGGQDLTYANYRAYDSLEQTVNLVTVDSRFDLGTIENEITSTSFLSPIIMEPPTNLFNYSNIGYQTYFNSQVEIQLIENLYFDAYRLG